ncbi:alkane 1-monooxygenase [Sediminitomix flava]|uniref:Alkane 1-monooxygenase n=1 Tax=Sediminitomix flava TaxID=379075 RepID=A0A315ZNU4_SEDFL|nr:alkane 1-monooxygenase [Sediminitomix flava]PWJ36149.1 alkane 1-monooxygenase [Sediminitomix flava]
MLRPLRYSIIFSLPLAVFLAFYLKGLWTFFPLVYSFGIIPFLELFIPPSTGNKSDEEYKSLLSNKSYDLVLYMAAFVHIGFLFYFLWIIQSPMQTWELIGCIISMGILCGTMGINLAHELGHRKTKGEQRLGQALLLTSLYMHFYIEHNRGHHRYVSTPQDPATSRLGEPLYAFWFRSMYKGYLSAWHLEKERLAKKKSSPFNLSNEFLQFQVVQIGLLVAVFVYGGWLSLAAFFSAAVIGILLLETVNYIEHYGLIRHKKKEHYERVQPWHSWNSDHVIGRTLLFELSRHSDHHYMASRKYQILRHFDDSPQMPTGYPGMMLLSAIPPLWFGVMNPRVEKYNAFGKKKFEEKINAKA